MEPTFDADGYPTEETLEAIKSWPVKDYPGWLDYISKAWHWPDYVRLKSKWVELHTGGWSGNESIIDAMEKNFMWYFYWLRSDRGGHYRLKRPQEKD